jgi:hypothetical protein
VAKITAQFAVVVGGWQAIAHGQQKALTVATYAKREQSSSIVGNNGLQTLSPAPLPFFTEPATYSSSALHAPPPHTHHGKYVELALESD